MSEVSETRFYLCTDVQLLDAAEAAAHKGGRTTQQSQEGYRKFIREESFLKRIQRKSGGIEVWSTAEGEGTMARVNCSVFGGGPWVDAMATGILEEFLLQLDVEVAETQPSTRRIHTSGGGQVQRPKPPGATSGEGEEPRREVEE